MKLKIIPAFQMLIFAGAAYLIQRLFSYPLFIYPIPAAIPASVFTAGIFIILTGGNLFRHANTTLTPRQPHKATELVTHGIYRYSRNPMYVGFMLVLLGWCLFLDNLLALIIPVLFILSMNILQIQHEEEALRQLFGEKYIQYCQQVRRWI